MNKSSDTIQTKNVTVKFVLFLAPAILIIIACIQLRIASTSKLSPWKGGGFGMFSTIESPSSRIIRIYLVTKDTKIAVQVPDQYRKLAAQIRTKPAQKEADELVKALSVGIWTTYEILPAQERYNSLHKKYFPGSTVTIDTAAGHSNIRYKNHLNELFSKMQWVHMLKNGESTNHPFYFEKVEVECLQMKFDKVKNKLVLHQMLKAQQDRYGNFNK